MNGYITHENPEFVDYNELYKILNQKFRATHDEIRYWIKCRDVFSKNFDLQPYLSDLPISFINSYVYPPDDFFYPTYYYYKIDNVSSFVPFASQRFVYIKNLALRNWGESPNCNRYDYLQRAAEVGYLRFYDREKDEFTYIKEFKSGNDVSKKFWFETEEGKEYIITNENFFLLEDILHMERAFFKKSVEDCLKELGASLEQ